MSTNYKFGSYMKITIKDWCLIAFIFICGLAYIAQATDLHRVTENSAAEINKL